MHSTHKRIKFLYAQSVLSTLQAIMVFIAALFTTALLPSLVVRFFYAEQDLFAAPPVVEYIPVVSFAISALYFLYVIVANLRRGMMIRSLTKQAELAEQSDCGDCGCGGCAPDTSVDMSELQELEELVDTAMKTKSATKKKSTKTKRTIKK